MNKMLYVLLLSMMMKSQCLPMGNDESTNPYSSHVVAKNNIVGGIKLEEGNHVEEEIKVIPKSTKARGYAARCGSIMMCTLVGGGIGAAIVAGEYGDVIVNAVFNLGAPIWIGGTVGYVVGWGIGNYAKARITKRI